MQGELISVVMPVYNTEELLGEAVESVLRQTYANWELLLIDDGSTDSSPAICDDYARRDPRIRTVHLPNAGVSHARNYGIDNTTGPWLCFLDSDDWLEPQAFSLLLQHAAGADMVMGRYPLASSAPFVHAEKVTAFYPQTWSDQERRNFACHRAIYSVWDKLYRRDSLCVRFHEDMNKWEDTCFNLELLPTWKKVVLLPEHLYHYRQFYSHSTLSNQIRIMQIPQLRLRYDLYQDAFGDFPDLAAPNNRWYIREVWEFFAALSLCIHDEALRLSITQMWLEDEQLVRITEGLELLKPEMRDFWNHVLAQDARAVNAHFLSPGRTEGQHE